MAKRQERLCDSTRCHRGVAVYFRAMKSFPDEPMKVADILSR